MSGPHRGLSSEGGPSSSRSSPYPITKPESRIQRTKLACAGCHRAKQRCEGLEDWPCHRCKTMKIDCIFPTYPSNGSDKSTATGKPRMKPGPKPKVKPEQNGAAPAAVAPASAPVATGATPDVAEQLRLMTARLASMEATLARAQITINPIAVPSLAGPSSLSGPTPGSSDSPLTNGPHHVHHHAYHSNDTTNPVEAAGEAMAVEGLVDLGGPGMAWRPDVLNRNLMTLAEVEQEFELFFKHISPWAAHLSDVLDRQPLAVRARSPLLFHAILLCAVYYRPTTEQNLELYKAIAAIHDSLLAPMILCPQPDHLNSDFIRSIYLVLLWKPVSYASLSARGHTNNATIQHLSKLNVRTSWMLRGMVARLSAFIGLPQITNLFAQHFAEQHIRPIPDEVVAEQRLYLGALFHESHGALQSGKPSNFLIHEALKTTRLFAALARQPSDVRLAASVELAATAATLLSNKQEHDRVQPADLATFDNELASWYEYWSPKVALDVDDPIASSTLFPYAAFIGTIVHGFAFSRWKAERKAAGLGLHDPAEWGQEDYESTAKAVETAQGLLLSVSVEGKKVDRSGIQTGWEAVGETLTLDPEAVAKLRWAPDSITCVVFSYPLLYLGRLANEGLLRFNMDLLPPTAAGPAPLWPTPADAPPSPSDKLCRLFTLGSELLEAIAPHPEHPATRQAQFLRQIRDAGLAGRRGTHSRPASPGPTQSFARVGVRTNTHPQFAPSQADPGVAGAGAGAGALPSAGLYAFPSGVGVGGFGETPAGSPQASGGGVAGMVLPINGDEPDQFSSLLSDMFQTGQPYLGMDFDFGQGAGVSGGLGAGGVDWTNLGFGDGF